ncbi:MAG: hypothetical protein AAF664_10790 [Planctomycetota bacterium]
MMKYWLAFAFLSAFPVNTVSAGDWSPDDDSFDPSVKSVLIEDRTWIGDPSPFLLVGSGRTGYTYTQATAWEGFDPSVNISLMVPIVPGETKAPGGGTLMLAERQAKSWIKTIGGLLKDQDVSSAKSIAIESAMGNAVWSVRVTSGEDGNRMIELENNQQGSAEVYRFSINATKKLLGAVAHSLKSLASNKDPSD